jgi:tRNA (guanine37-N1)-methyltransferase
MKRFDIMTLFPDMMSAVLEESITGRALRKGLFEIRYHHIRDYTQDKHRRVDRYPYGGSPGMLMQAQPIYNCFEYICEENGRAPYLVYMSPQGTVLTQGKAIEMSQYDHLAILCGHYEGVDERVIEEIVDEEISIGDYVLTGGEIPAMVLVDCICRLIPGVLSDEENICSESHFDGLLEYPQYTHPQRVLGREVPEILLSGHHANIAKWRREQSLLRTLKRRPDLLEKAMLTDEDYRFLQELLSRREKELMGDGDKHDLQ